MITSKSLKMIEATYRDDRILSLPRDFHSHHAYEIFLFHEGCCSFIIHNRVYELRPGNLIILDGKVLHRPNPHKQPYVRSVLHFSPEYMNDTLHTLDLIETLSIFTTLNNRLLQPPNNVFQTIDSLLKKITYLYRGAYGVDEWNIRPNESKQRETIRMNQIKLHIAELMLDLYEWGHNRTPNRKQATEKSEWEAYTKKMIVWINHHFDQKIKLDDMAQDLNLDKYHMSRVFKKITGQTIMDYVRNCRLNKAMYLLESFPHQSILHVSEQSGFESSAYFSRFFVKKTGMRPSEFRQNTQERIMTYRDVVPHS